MNFDVIVGIVIIIIFIIKAKNKKRDQIGGKNKSSSSGYTTNRNIPVNTTRSATSGQGNIYQSRPVQNSSAPNRNGVNYSRPGQNGSASNYNGNFAVVSDQKRVPPNVERDCRVEDKHQSENNLSGKNTAKPSSVPNVQRAYTETPKQTREQKKATRMIAKRLYEGDRVPQGYRMLKCSYCAAENLIAHSAKGAYMCYFCHTDLK